MALLLSVAGCSTAAPVDDGTATPTLTPAEVPEEPRGPVVGPSGVGDAAALVAAHERALAARANATHSYEVTVLGGRYRNPRVEYLRAATRNGSAYTARVVDAYSNATDGGAPHYDRYERRFHTVADRTYVRVEHGPNVSYRTRSRVPPPFETTRGSQLRALFGAASVTVAEGSPETGDYRVVDESFEARRLPVRGRAVADAEVTEFVATVTDEGVVRSYRFNYEGSVDGTPVAGWVRVEFTTRDDPPRSPDWLSEARAATTADDRPGTPTTTAGG